VLARAANRLAASLSGGPPERFVAAWSAVDQSNGCGTLEVYSSPSLFWKCSAGDGAVVLCNVQTQAEWGNLTRQGYPIAVGTQRHLPGRAPGCNNRAPALGQTGFKDLRILVVDHPSALVRRVRGT
jgi:hypothetical protein